MTVLPRDDTSYMLEAAALAARIPRRPWPNPPVGALVVSADGVVVGRGAHHGAGRPHAETIALEEAGERARGATLYCTLEPCNHYGRTPPCAPRVVASGVQRVVVGVRDPHPHITGRGLEVIGSAGIAVTLGVAADTCLDLVWPFVATQAFSRPYVLLKTATTLDGLFAPLRVPGRDPTAPVYLTRLEARREVHRLRRWADLVLVGAGTMRADQPALDGRLCDEGDLCPTEDPRRAYVDADLAVEIPASWRGRAFVAFGGSNSATLERVREVERAGGAAVRCEERDGLVVPDALLGRLADLGVHSVMVEGGPRLAHALLSRGLVDRWDSFVAPGFLGDGVGWPRGEGREGGVAHAAEDAVGGEWHFHATRCERVGADVRVVYDRRSFDEMLRELTGFVASSFSRP